MQHINIFLLNHSLHDFRLCTSTALNAVFGAFVLTFKFFMISVDMTWNHNFDIFLHLYFSNKESSILSSILPIVVFLSLFILLHFHAIRIPNRFKLDRQRITRLFRCFSTLRQFLFLFSTSKIFRVVFLSRTLSIYRTKCSMFLRKIGNINK